MIDPGLALDTYERRRAEATGLQRYHAAADGAAITCRHGCSACCSQMVTITLADALSIARHLVRKLRQNDLAILVNRLQRDGEDQRAAGGPVEWIEKDRPCTFLGDKGECTVYDVRPVNCRRMLVTTPKEWCSAKSLLKVIRTGEGGKPSMRSWPEFNRVEAEAQEVVRPMLQAGRIDQDLPPAPLPLAVVAAIHALWTGSPESLRSWAGSWSGGRNTAAISSTQAC